MAVCTCEDVPMFALNIGIILSSLNKQDLSITLLLSTLFNALMLGAKLPKLKRLKDLYTQEDELEGRIFRRVKTLERAGRRLGQEFDDIAADETEKVLLN